jgi:alpha-glucosidase
MRSSRTLLLALLFFVGPCVRAQAGWQTIGNVSSFEKTSDGITIRAQRGSIRVSVLSPTVVRVRYSQQNQFSDRVSFAVLPERFRRVEYPQWQLQDSPRDISLTTGAITARIYKSPARITFLRGDGSVISEDLPASPPAFNGSEFKVWKSMPEDEHYFGLGDKTGPMDHRNLAFTMWNTDAFGWQESTDPLYKDIPFIFAFRNGASYGIFLDNTYRSSFDFGKERGDAYSFGAEGGDLNYYFIFGPEPKRVVEQFTQLVGRTPLPPLFALGYQQCRYSYYPESQVREIASEFRKRTIPADVVYLDIDYQNQNRPFTVDPQKFPNFQGMIKDLRAEGFKVIAITDLHIAAVPGYKPYDEGMKAGYFVKNPDGSVYVGKVWPGDSVFPDFTRAEVRRWWGTLYSDFVKDGVRGFWNDMNEPSVFEVPSKTMPLDTVHNVEGRLTDHREIHNVFGMENARATYEGLLQLKPDERPFVLTRAAYAGAPRYAATWTGDNTASWNHMRISVPELLNLGLSGYAFVGDDIGGFNGSPTPELLTRWMELGAFNPIYRNHATKGTRFREPWVDGPEHEAIRKRYIETRYRLLPYIYTGMEEASRTGVPLMRPLFLEFPDQPLVALNDQEFMFGENLLVAPKAWPFLDPYTVTLPAGDWYDFWTGAKISGQTLQVNPGLDTLPVYVRAGSIIPEQPVVQNTDEIPQGPLTLDVYPGPQCHGSLYADDGNTLAYEHGDIFRVSFTCEAKSDHIDVSISAPDGLYDPWFHEAQINIYGVTQNVSSVTADSRSLMGWTQQSGVLTLPAIKLTAAPHHFRVAMTAAHQ